MGQKKEIEENIKEEIEDKENEENTEEESALSKLIRIFRVLPIVLKLIRPQLTLILINYAIVLIQARLRMMRTQYLGGIVDVVIKSKSVEELKEFVISMVIYFVVSGLVNKIAIKYSVKASGKFSENVKCDLYNQILESDLAVFDKMSTYEVSEIVSSGVSALEELFFTRIVEILMDSVTIIGNLYLMCRLLPDLGLIVFMIIPAKFILMMFTIKGNIDVSERYSKAWTEVWDHPMEIIMNIALVKCFSTEKKEQRLYKEKQKNFTDLQTKREGGSWFQDTVKSIIEQGTGIILVWLGGIRVLRGEVTPGEFSTFNISFAIYNESVSEIDNHCKWTFSAFVDSQKLLKFLDIKSKVTAHYHSENIIKPNLKGSISIKNLSFSYPSNPEVEILNNINLDINPGDSIALVGASGSGKTTLTYLIQNLYTPIKGEIIIDRENVKDYDVAWLHRHMGYVAQEPVLLNRSIEENITYGLDTYQADQLSRALTLSNARFILNKKKFKEGLQTKIGPEGIQLSGGQKQRIAIARAFIKDPKILILDEPTSALDGESESKVQKAIDELINVGDMTVIVVAHRLSTIVNCKKIVVLEDGQIMEEGTHKELIEKDGVYKKLFEFQLNTMQKI